MGNRIYLKENEMVELIRATEKDRSVVNVAFSPGGRVWLQEPYDMTQLKLIAEMRGIDPTPTSEDLKEAKP